MARIRTRNRWPSSERRRTAWARQSGSISLASGTGDYTVANLLSQYASDGGNTAGVTVARTHIRLAAINITNPADDFYWGLIASPVSVVGSELTGVPTPFSDPYAQWAMWEHLVASHDAPTAYQDGHFWGASNNHQYDIKSKRKLDQLQMGWCLVVEAGIDAETIDITYQASILLMLP